MHLAADLDVHVAADDRLDHAVHDRDRCEMAARQRQHILEVLQMRHEWVQVAFQRRLPTLGQRQQIVEARPRRGASQCSAHAAAEAR